MKNYLNALKIYVFSHKILSIIVLIVLLVVGYNVYKNLTNTTGEVRYITAQVAKGTIISSVTGSGQVSALNQISIQPQVSGSVTYRNINPGDNVRNGTLLFSIDDTNAQKAVRDAELNLQTAQISLNKLKIQDSTQNTAANLVQSYDNGFNSVSNTFLDIPGIMTGLNDMFFKATITNNGQWNVDWYEAQVKHTDVDAVKPYKQNFIDSYNIALKAYTDALNTYQSASRGSDNATIDNMISQTYTTLKLISDAIKNANNYINFVNTSIKSDNNRTPPSIIATNQSTLNDYTNKTNTHLGDLLGAQTSISGAKDNSPNTNLDIQSAELSITQKENALQDAKDNLSYYSVRAPFDGIIASVPAHKGDNVGSGTTLATIITQQQLATISLNEIDVAKIQLGQKVTLTFDAISGLTITGKVAQIDSIGTVSSGVVNYNVQISFDTYDSRIKPGMSVTAAIITNIQQNVLIVPNNSIKTIGGVSYVQTFSTPLPPPLTGTQGSPSKIPPIQTAVTIGIANSTSTEITSGLNEGDIIVTRTINPTTTTSTTSAPSILGTSSGGARSGGAIRIGG